MRLVNLLPEKFIESDFVTKQRLKYDADPKRQKIVHTIAYATGAVIGASVAVGGIVAIEKIVEKINEKN